MQATGYLHGTIRRQPRKGYEVWELRYRLPNGKQSDKILGKVWDKQSRPPEGHLTRQMAEAAARRFLDEHADSVPADRKTFGRAVTEYRRHCKEILDLSPNTLIDYKGICANLLKRQWRQETWEQRPLDSFEVRDLTAVEDELRARGLGNHRLNIWRGVIRGIFGLNHRAIQEWVWAKQKQTASKGKIRCYDPDQVAALYEHASDLRDLTAYTLATELGMRTNEFRGLKIPNLDFKRHIVRIEDGYTDNGGDRPTKTYRVRSVPMTEHAEEVLSRIVAGREPYDDLGNPQYVLEEGPGHPMSYHPLAKRFKKAQVAAGLPSLTLHKLRHTFGTQMIAHPKIDIFVLQKLMGHQDIKTTTIYLHYQPDDDLRAIMSSTWRRPEPGTVVPLRRAS